MKKPELTAAATQEGEISPQGFQAALCPTRNVGGNLCLAPGCLRIGAMQGALSLHNPGMEEPGGTILTLQRGRSSSKPALLFVSSPKCCLWCRCEDTDLDSVPLLTPPPRIWLLRAGGRRPTLHHRLFGSLPGHFVHCGIPGDATDATCTQGCLERRAQPHRALVTGSRQPGLSPNYRLPKQRLLMT